MRVCATTEMIMQVSDEYDGDVLKEDKKVSKSAKKNAKRRAKAKEQSAAIGCTDS